MHSFASALIAAALATLTSAAPAGLPVSVPSVLSSSPVSDPLALLSGVIPSIGQLSSVEGGVGSVTGLARVRDVNSEITDAITSIQSGISGVRRRDAQLSVAAIFDIVSTETEPYIEQLTYIVPSNCTITQITNIVDSIKAPILAAVPELEALVGAELSVVLAPLVGTVELTVSQVAAIVGCDVDLILAAAGNVLAVAQAHDSDIVADVEDILADLGSTVTDLVGAVLPLVDGLAASLAPVVAPVDAVIIELQLTDLAADLGLSA